MKACLFALSLLAAADTARGQDRPPAPAGPMMTWASVVRQRVSTIATDRRRTGRGSMQVKFELDAEGHVQSAEIGDSSVRKVAENRMLKRLRATRFPSAPDAQTHQMTVRINFR